jgi:tetratricopeptide (TPR) repeat protein
MAAEGLTRHQFRLPGGILSLWSVVLLILGLSLAAALGGLLLPDGASSSTPRLTAAEESTAREARIAFFEARAVADPLDVLSLNTLASEYLQRGRETGDVSDYQRADVAAGRSLEILPKDNYAGLVLLGSVRLVQHDYTAVEDLANQALPLKLAGPSAYGLLGDAQVGLGRYDDAYTNYAKMLELDAGLPALSRMANLAYLTGNRFNSIDYWKQAIAKSADLSLENQAWVHVQLGVTYFMYGDLDAAAKEHEKALKLFPDYVHALAGLAQVRAGQQRYDEAIDLYSRAISRLPQPQYVTALGDVYAAAGRPGDAERQYALVEAIATLYRSNGINTDLQISLFYADHDRQPEQALTMARAAYDEAPSVYAADALAWALHVNGRDPEAASFADRALSKGTQDANFLYHAALIQHALGEHAQALSYLQRALDLNPRFSPLHADAARQLLNDLEASR